MEPAARRIERALSLFDEGDVYAEDRKWSDAKACYQDGHDLVVDLPKYHAMAHRRLLPANEALGDREARVDRTLGRLEPYGVFALIAAFFRVKVRLTGHF